MTNQELTAKLNALQQTLPDHLRDALDINQLRLRNELRLKSATPATGALAGAKPKPADAALLAYAENPLLQILNSLLHLFTDSANAQIPQAFRTTPIDLFGDANNRLDPLNFHSSASTSASGEACLPQACTTIFGFRVCVPPFSICAGGGASAGLNVLNGLSTARISSITILDVPAPKASIVTVNGNLALSAGSLSASGFAEAHGGPFGINIPVSASGSAELSNVTITSAVVLTFDISKPKLTGIQIQNLSVNYGSISINISGLGPFNSLLGPLVDSLKSIVQQFFNVNGAISSALQGVLQTQLNNLLK